MDFENKNITAPDNVENSEKKGGRVWKHVGLVAVALFLAVLTVVIINL